jgi:hypothetical protein
MMTLINAAITQYSMAEAPPLFRRKRFRSDISMLRVRRFPSRPTRTLQDLTDRV